MVWGRVVRDLLANGLARLAQAHNIQNTWKLKLAHLHLLRIHALHENLEEMAQTISPAKYAQTNPVAREWEAKDKQTR